MLISHQVIENLWVNSIKVILCLWTHYFFWRLWSLVILHNLYLKITIASKIVHFPCTLGSIVWCIQMQIMILLKIFLSWLIFGSEPIAFYSIYYFVNSLLYLSFMVESMNFIKIYQMTIEEQHLNCKSINAKMNSEWASYIVIWGSF